ncbi:MAG: CPBP family intramembrane metalloprotease [Pirellulaceae bacterium]|nr:CPBP family intramembrane metalloprotease [Pirellulaceae bacterium]
MKWSNVKLILAREVRDQLRDRRTLFMIAVLPILLYPLLGMSFFQVSQFMREHPTKVYVIGASPTLSEGTPLIENERFAPGLFNTPDKVGLLDLHFAPDVLAPGETLDNVVSQAKKRVERGEFDAAVYFPPNFGEQLRQFREASESLVNNRRDEESAAARNAVIPSIPRPEIIFTTANEKSQITFARLHDVLRRWSDEVGKANLSAAGLVPSAARPIELATDDLADATGNAGRGLWAKLLPVMLLLWALTGAFYPAVDLCAGEKERGTLETLLSSPADRSEIVIGKLVTIMLFSMATAILNLISMGFTGWLIVANHPSVGLPSWLSCFWLLLALIPISALFSALCLALAALARSTKEGQYYLMPLMLICMPLAVLPMTPGFELTLGNSLIPVANVVLLLRTLLEGNTLQALRYAVPVVGVTLACCYLAIRWAVDQFNQESVLFRESERLDLGLWLRRVIRDRRPTPTVGVAVSAGILMLLVRFFMAVTMTPPVELSFGFLIRSLVTTQIAVVIVPMVLMTLLFTRNPAETFLLDRSSWKWTTPLAVLAAIALAVALHPVIVTVALAVTHLYPMSETAELLSETIKEAPNLWILLLFFAVVPAVCEEFAYRGFILSGLRHSGKKWRAIVVTSLFFGVSHFMLQQSLMATLSGMVIGYIAVQSGNLLPCIAYHVVNNGLFVAMTRITPETIEEWPVLQWLSDGVGQAGYHWTVVIIGFLTGFLLIGWFSRLPYQRTNEERLQEAIRRGMEVDDKPLASTAT